MLSIEFEGALVLLKLSYLQEQNRTFRASTIFSLFEI